LDVDFASRNLSTALKVPAAAHRRVNRGKSFLYKHRAVALRFFVGWEPAQETFFVQIFSPNAEDPITFGDHDGEIPTVIDLGAILSSHAEETGHAALTPELRERLEKDKAESDPQRAEYLKEIRSIFS
jgi:hypothetical protein